MIEFIKNYNRIELLYYWIIDGKVNVEQFRELIEIDKKENQRQYDLDSWD